MIRSMRTRLRCCCAAGCFPSLVYPAERRATRDLLRRRCHLARKRANLLAHIHNTKNQYNLLEIGKRLANKSNREDREPRRARGDFCAGLGQCCVF
jgi:hypothetical protein